MKTFLKENFFKFMIGLSAFIVSIAILMYIISITKSPSSLNERVTGDPIRIGRLEIAEFYRLVFIQNIFPLIMCWILFTQNEYFVKWLSNNRKKKD